MKILTAVFLFIAGIFLLSSIGLLDAPLLLDGGGEIFVREDTLAEVEEEIVPVAEKEFPRELETGEANEVVLSGENIQKTESLPSASLTELGILLWTNTQRINNGAAPLSKSLLLDELADAKLGDMFEKQYFAHEAPNGDDVSDLADHFGYEYLLIGENLAYGDFANDRKLVDAWMDSPAHRENILRAGYTEIGIAVRKGFFKGKETWIAVQNFGTPQSACDLTSGALLEDINDGRKELDNLEEELGFMRDEIESTYPKEGPEYNAKVSAYNQLVVEYNDLLKTVNSWVKIYNGQVEEYQDCVKSVM